jgi:hypothetical protein
MNTLLLDIVSPGVRRLQVRERVRAMRGRLAEALETIATAMSARTSGPDADLVALGLFKAELLYLERQESAAVETIETLVQPRATGLPEPIRFVVEGNAAHVRWSSAEPGSTTASYHLVDRRRKARHEWFDYLDVVTALDDAAAGRYNQAVAPLWRELVRAYRQAYWPAQVWAGTRYAKLCLDMGELEGAAYHVVLAGAEQLVEPLAAAVSARRDVGLVDRLVRRLLGCAGLARHFVVASKLVARLSDVLPDALVSVVGEWVLPRCREDRDTGLGPQLLPAALRLVRQLGHRMPVPLAERLIECATHHPAWLAPAPEENHIVRHRDDLAKAVTSLAHAVPTTALPALAEASLPLVVDRLDTHSYADVVELLAQIAARGGESVKSRIADALYAPGQPPTRILAQVDRLFGRQALTNEQLEAFAERVANETRLQVQRVGPGQAAIRLPETLGVHGRTDGTGPQVTVVTGVGMAALARQRDRLSTAAISSLIHAILSAVADPDNVPANQALLLEQLAEFADRAEVGLKIEVFAGVEPVAAAPLSQARQTPRSAFAGFYGNPEEMRRAALVCLTAFSAGDESRVSRVEELITGAAVDPSPAIRRTAFDAAAKFPGLPADAVPALLMGLRDPNPATAGAAFSAFASRPDWKLSRANWAMFLLAVQFAADSPGANLRRHAALALAVHARGVPSGLRRDSADLLRRFANDISAVVRDAVRPADLEN